MNEIKVSDTVYNKNDNRNPVGLYKVLEIYTEGIERGNVLVEPITYPHPNKNNELVWSDWLINTNEK